MEFHWQPATLAQGCASEAQLNPVAGRNNEFIEIPSAPCGFDVASATGGQFWNPMSKQPERQSAIKKNKVLRVTRYFISIKKK